MKKMLIISLVIVIVIVGGFMWFNRDTKEAGSYPPTVEETAGSVLQIEAKGESAGLIPLDTLFTITTSEGMTLEQLKSQLKVVPDQSYSLTQDTPTAYTLKPESQLPRHQVIQFSYPNADRLAGWAFQTVDSFRVKSVYPANESLNVDVKTGIEIELSQAIDLSIEDYIEIAPEIEYKVEIQDTRVIILPKALEKDVRYLVTLKKGYSPDGEAILKSDTQFTFSTGDVNAYTNSSSFSVALMSHNTPKRLQLNYFNDEPVLFKVYRFGNVSDYLEKLDLYNEKAQFYKNPLTEMALGGVSPVVEEKVSPITEDYNQFLYLPDTLTNGYYLALVQGSDNTAFAFFQLSDYAIYGEASQNHLLFFGINALNNELITEGSVISSGKNVGSFNNDGVALVTESVEQEYYVVETAGDSVVFPMRRPYMGFWSFPSEQPSSARRVFLNTDRSTYKPTDTIYLYGVINPKKGEVLQELKVELSHSWMSAPPIFEAQVQLDDYKSFDLDIPLQQVESGYYRLAVYSGEVLVAEKGISIETYEKPEFQVTQQLDKAVIINGETVTVTGRAAYFDDTPLKNYALNAYTGSDYFSLERRENLMTNDLGQFEWTYSPIVQYNNWRPIYYTFKTGNQLAENKEIGDIDGLYLFPSDMALRGKGTVDDQLGKLIIETNALNVPKTADNFGEDYQSVVGAAMDMPVWITVKENYYEAISTGMVYDDLRKINVETFRYEYKENTIANTERQTIDGKTELLFTAVPNRGYIAEISAVDKYGKTIMETVYFSGNGISVYEGASSTARFGVYSASYALGEPFEQHLETPADADLTLDRTLFLTYQNEFRDYTVTDEPVFKHVFKEEDVPNIILKAIYYDGFRFNTSQYENTCSLQMKDTEKNLNVEVETTDEAYRPGEEATFTIKTKINGRATAAQIAVSIVDEAYFALYPDYSDIRRELFNTIYETGIIAFYYPGYNAFYGMAEGGEGEAASSALGRSIFKDTADFIIVRTDQNGVATVKTIVPDNLTTWRVTAHGMTQQLDAGTGKGKLRVSLPFFIRLLESPVYLTGEEPSMVLRADGEQVGGRESVDYTLDLTAPDGSRQSYQAKGQAYSYTPVTLGQLKEGSYGYTVSGKTGSLTDSISGTFEVVKSRMDFDAYRKTALSNAFKLSGSHGNTRLTFWNTEALAYFDLLSPMLSGDNERVEWIIGEAEADALMFNSADDSWFRQNALNLLPAFIDYSGGIKPLVNAEPSIYTTVSVASLNQGYLPSQSAIHYFTYNYNSDESTKREKLLALWGLACYGEPILTDLNKWKQMDLNQEENIILAMAYAQIGDLERAHELYLAFDPIRSSALSTESLYMLANLGALFQGDKTAELWFENALKKTPESHAFQLEQVKFLKFIKTNLKPASVNLIVNGVEQTLTLNDHMPLEVYVGKSDSFEVKDVTGAVTVQEHYKGNSENVDLMAKDLVTVKRQASNSNPKLSDVIDISLQVAFKGYNSVQVYEFVPSGFAAVGGFVSESRQVFYGGVVNNQHLLNTSYQLRAKQQGVFKLEPSVVTVDGTTFVFSDGITLIVDGE